MSKEREAKTSHKPAESHEGKLLTSFCMAALGFLTIILTHQLLLGALSYALGYETHITFGKVISEPYDNKYWSSNRVILMYAMPSIGYLFAGSAIAVYLLIAVKTVTLRYWYLYWCLVFCILFITSQLAIAPLAALIGKGPLYQGISVVTNWWGVDALKLFLLSFFAFAINLAFGVITFRLLIQLSPSRSAMHRKSGQLQIIGRYFILPIALLFPVAMLLAYPDTILFFGVLFLSALLWLPGYFMKAQDGYHFSGKAARAGNVTVSGKWLAGIAVFVILIRLFL